MRTTNKDTSSLCKCFLICRDLHAAENIYSTPSLTLASTDLVFLRKYMSADQNVVVTTPAGVVRGVCLCDAFEVALGPLVRRFLVIA
uniref:Uncharacterized protein n=1 Tax=Pararge aegeria TaxID=116150 RepID=S4NMB9_9NEOP